MTISETDTLQGKLKRKARDIYRYLQTAEFAKFVAAHPNDVLYLE